MEKYQVSKLPSGRLTPVGEYLTNRGYLPPPKWVFENYHSYGMAISWRKFAKILGRMGYRNPKSGNIPTFGALVFAYWRYALRNPVESFEFARLHPTRMTKDFVTLEDWYQTLYNKALTDIFSDGQRERWLEDNKDRIEIIPVEEESE